MDYLYIHNFFFCKIYYLFPDFFLKNDGMSKSLLLIGSGCVDTCVVFFSQGLALLLLGISLTGTVPIFGFVSNPVAITVITISSSRLSSITAPKIMFASGSTLRCTNSAAVLLRVILSLVHQ